MVTKSTGMTLVEMAVTLAIMAMLMAAAAPYTMAWAQKARVNEAKTKLQQGYDLAKALALRNSVGVRADAIAPAAAGIKLVGATLLVCTGDPATTATCAVGAGGSVRWQTTLPANTSADFGAGNSKMLGLDNTGMPLSTTEFSITNGGESESGNFV